MNVTEWEKIKKKILGQIAVIDACSVMMTVVPDEEMMRVEVMKAIFNLNNACLKLSRIALGDPEKT